VTDRTSSTLDDQTEVGSYFVATYPPFSAWTTAAVEDGRAALETAPAHGVPLGLYLHIPFCRKRCHFCYFRVYTDKNAQEVGDYLDVLAREWELCAAKPAIAGRPLNFVYFGGGTPSFLSTKQLEGLVGRLSAVTSWKDAEEVTFECEPGTLTEAKLASIRGIGVTRLSLGVENFNDEILELNGRAHRSPEIGRSYAFARSLGFPQINIDLIAGMMGESEERWRETVRRAIELEPDSVTIYQMELPYNTVISQDMIKRGLESPIADWPTKRRWVDYAFDRFQERGYRIASAYTLATTKKPCRFIYTDALWHGGDMIGLGVSSFSHFGGVNFQNARNIEEYIRVLETDQLQLWRALPLTSKQRLIREMILQLKTGSLNTRYFERKFGANVWEEFRPVYERLGESGMLTRGDGRVELTRQGLLQIDHLLPQFFETELVSLRYV
jgi:oxygen-independent coproporphyrinogen-3 oxidase